jgi:hypothetical protein
MKNKQNEVLTAVKVLIENKMYREAMELINASMLPETVFTEHKNTTRCVVCGANHEGLQCPDFSTTSKQEWMKS